MTQREEILQILRECGKSGMNSYQWRSRFIQLPVRILELKRMGNTIIAKLRKNKSVDYILIKETHRVLKKGHPVIETDVRIAYHFIDGVAIPYDIKPKQETFLSE